MSCWPIKTKNIQTVTYDYIMMLLKNVLRDMRIIESLPRISNMVFSVVFLIILLRGFSVETFALVASNFVVASLLVWIGDMGSLSNMIMCHAKSEDRDVTEYWSVRITLIFGFTLLVILASYAMGISRISPLLLFACILDLHTDSMVAFRQVTMSVSKAFLIQFSRKATQVLAMLIYLQVFQSLSVRIVSLVLITPALIVFIFDTRNAGGVSKFSPKKLHPRRLGVWFQSGGTLISGLDTLVFADPLYQAFLRTLSMSKRITSGLAVFGSTNAIHALYETAKSGSLKINSMKEILNQGLTVFLLSIPICWLIPNIFEFSTGDAIDSELVLVGRIIVLATFLGVISSNLNAILVGLGKNSLASISTYGSSLLYLLLVAIMVANGSSYYHLSLCVVANLAFECAISGFFIVQLGKKTGAGIE